MSENDQDKKPKEDNVIPFPVEKVKSRRRLKKLAGKLGDNRKATLFLSLAFLLVFSSLMLQVQKPVDRGLATSVDNRNPELEKQMSRDLRDANPRKPAHYGRKPSSDEVLREQDLNRGYVLTYDGRDGRVSEIQFRESGDSMYQPVFVRDREKFLMKYRDLITPSYEAVEPVQQRGVSSDRISESFSLLKDGQPAAQVYFYFFEDGKLSSMKVQLLDSNP